MTDMFVLFFQWLVELTLAHLPSFEMIERLMKMSYHLRIVGFLCPMHRYHLVAISRRLNKM